MDFRPVLWYKRRTGIDPPEGRLFEKWFKAVVRIELTYGALRELCLATWLHRRTVDRPAPQTLGFLLYRVVALQAARHPLFMHFFRGLDNR